MVVLSLMKYMASQNIHKKTVFKLVINIKSERKHLRNYPGKYIGN